MSELPKTSITELTEDEKKSLINWWISLSSKIRDNKVYDPINDELVKYSLSEYIDEAIASLLIYKESFIKNPNNFHSSKHTFNEWGGAFTRFMSW